MSEIWGRPPWASSKLYLKAIIHQTKMFCCMTRPKSAVCPLHGHVSLSASCVILNRRSRIYVILPMNPWWSLSLRISETSSDTAGMAPYQENSVELHEGPSVGSVCSTTSTYEPPFLDWGSCWTGSSFPSSVRNQAILPSAPSPF